MEDCTFATLADHGHACALAGGFQIMIIPYLATWQLPPRWLKPSMSPVTRTKSIAGAANFFGWQASLEFIRIRKVSAFW
jgi:hypothetical protein